MKKKIIATILLITILVFAFTGCKKDQTKTINQDKREISEITCTYREYSAAEVYEYKFTVDEIVELIPLFDGVGTLERKALNLTHQEQYYNYVLEIKLKKKFLRKDITYTVSIGEHYKMKNIFDGSMMWVGDNSALVMKYDGSYYRGSSTDELLLYLEKKMMENGFKVPVEEE